MRAIFLITCMILPFLGMGQNIEKTTFKVYGACGMCESRIENAANSVDGVTSADWNQETMMLAIEFDADKVNLDHVHKIIAEAGHDTEKFRAKDEVYQALPACCHYERPAKNKTEESDKSKGSCCSQ